MLLLTPSEVRAAFASAGVAIAETDAQLIEWFDQNFLKQCGIAPLQDSATGARKAKAVIEGAQRPTLAGDGDGTPRD